MTDHRGTPADNHAADGLFSYEGHDLEALFDLENYQRWVVEQFVSYLGGHTVELGAGIGAYSRRLLEHVSHLDIVEPSDNLISRLASGIGKEWRVTVFPQTVEEYLAACPSASRDNVVLINLLEHVADDHRTMQDLARIVRPGGHALIFVPALPALYSRLDSQLGHFRRYTAASLTDAVESPAWRVAERRYFDLLGVVPWWIVNTVCGKQSFDPRMARLYDRFGVPATRALETLVQPPIGKNLLLIAERHD